MTVSEATLGALLSAVMPYDTIVENEIGALGITKTITMNVSLTNPRLKVTAQGIQVTLDYAVTGSFSKSGTATPTMVLTPVPSRQIIEGKLGSYYAQVVLPDQPTIRDPKVSVKQMLAAQAKSLGASTLSVPRFVRFKVGESA